MIATQEDRNDLSPESVRKWTSVVSVMVEWLSLINISSLFSGNDLRRLSSWASHAKIARFQQWKGCENGGFACDRVVSPGCARRTPSHEESSFACLSWLVIRLVYDLSDDCFAFFQSHWSRLSDRAGPDRTRSRIAGEGEGGHYEAGKMRWRQIRPTKNPASRSQRGWCGSGCVSCLSSPASACHAEGEQAERGEDEGGDVL
jgi:hypothetical protein